MLHTLISPVRFWRVQYVNSVMICITILLKTLLSQTCANSLLLLQKSIINEQLKAWWKLSLEISCKTNWIGYVYLYFPNKKWIWSERDIHTSAHKLVWFLCPPSCFLCSTSMGMVNLSTIIIQNLLMGLRTHICALLKWLVVSQIQAAGQFQRRKTPAMLSEVWEEREGRMWRRSRRRDPSNMRKLPDTKP